MNQTLWLASPLVLVVAAIGAAPAAAEPVRAQIMVDTASCPDIDGAALLLLARAEVDALVRAVAPDAVPSLSLRCVDGEVELTGVSPGTRAPVVRRIASRGPDSRDERLLALELAELALLVIDRSGERAAEVPPVAGGASPAAPPPPAGFALRVTRSVTPPQRLETAVAVVGRRSWTAAGRLQGLGIRLARRGWTADSVVETGTRQAMRGRVELATATVGVARPLGVGGRRWRAWVAPGVRVGLLRLAGRVSATDEMTPTRSMLGPTGGPTTTAGATVAVHRQVEAYVAGELLFNVLGVRAAVEPGGGEIDSTGMAVSVDVGVRWGF